MANPGIPTSRSHDKSIPEIMNEANVIFINAQGMSLSQRTAMVAGAVADSAIRDLWVAFAEWKIRLGELSRVPEFFKEYALHRGLSFVFDSTADTNVAASQEKIINLPDNHRFKTDTRVRFHRIEGALPGGLVEGTDYWVFEPLLNALSLTAAEGGAGGKINLSNAVGVCEMRLHVRPDYASLRTAINDALTEIELNLTQRAATYDQANAELTYSTRSSVETGALQTDLQAVEDLIDIVAA